MKSWFNEDGTLACLAAVDGDRLHVQPSGKLQDTLRAAWIPCVYGRAPGAPASSPKSMRAILGPFHWPTVRGLLPGALVAHVEAERPAWLAWLAREEAFRAARPVDPVALLESPQQSLFGSPSGSPSFEPPVDASHPWHSLFAYQRVGVRWAHALGGRGVIGDDMGLGKTAQFLSYLETDPGASRALLVCPGSLLVNWTRECARWAPSWTSSVAWTSREVEALATGAASRPARHLSVVSWGLLSRAVVAEALLQVGFDAVGADEAHNIKSWEAARSQAMVALMHQARVRLPLTGTPVKSRPAEFWTLLHAVDPVRFHTFLPWGETFCGPSDKRVGMRTVRTYSGATRLPQLATLTTSYVLRREKRDVLRDLPPKRRQVLPQPGPPGLVKATADLLQEIRDQARSATGGGVALGQIGKLRVKVGLAKVPAAVEWALDAHASGEPTVLFVYHREVAKALREGLEAGGLRVGEILGGTASRDRQAVVDAFQSGKLDVIVGSEAMKEGVTLVRAAFSLQVEWWWTPGDLEQAEDRLCRIGQVRPVLNAYLLLLDTLDEYMSSLVEDKRDVVTRSLVRDELYKLSMGRLVDEET